MKEFFIRLLTIIGIRLTKLAERLFSRNSRLAKPVQEVAVKVLNTNLVKLQVADTEQSPGEKMIHAAVLRDQRRKAKNLGKRKKY